MRRGRGSGLTAKRAVNLSIAGMLVVSPQLALADSDILTNGSVTATGGYSTNPYNVVGNDTGSAFVEADARPEVEWMSERSVILITGNLDYKHFFRDYSDTVDFRVGADYVGRATSRLTTHLNASYDSAIVGGFDATAPVSNAGEPPPPPTTGTDVALIGTRARRRALDFAGDVAYVLSERDSLTANAYYDVSHYGGQGASFGTTNYDSYGGGMSYSRRVSEQLQLGAQGSVGRYVYSNILGGTDVLTLQATASDKFSDSWKANAALGASHVNRQIGGQTTNLTGNASLCHLGQRLTMCLSAADAVLPTGGTGTVNSRSAFVTGSYVLTEHSTVSLSGSYTYNSTPVAALAIDRTVIGNAFASTTASYDRTLSQRIHLVASAHFRQITSGSDGHPQDIGGSVGISVRLGEYR